MPRSRIVFSTARDVNIFPTEQSVPTVSRRRPGRFVPLATSKVSVGWRTSYSLRPCSCARLESVSISVSLLCRPDATSKPMTSAFSSVARQDGGITPPRLATPTITVLHPAAWACSKVISGRPRSALQPSRRSWPLHQSGRHFATPLATFAARSSAASPKNIR